MFGCLLFFFLGFLKAERTLKICSGKPDVYLDLYKSNAFENKRTNIQQTGDNFNETSRFYKHLITQQII